jgi:hypothetical protein
MIIHPVIPACGVRRRYAGLHEECHYSRLHRDAIISAAFRARRIGAVVMMTMRLQIPGSGTSADECAAKAERMAAARAVAAMLSIAADTVARYGNANSQQVTIHADPTPGDIEARHEKFR